MDSNTLSVLLLILFLISLSGTLASLLAGKPLGWKVGLIASVVFLCMWGLNPRLTESGGLDFALRGGLDLTGGTSLLYEVDVSGSDNATEAMQRTIDSLSKRIDPSGQANLVWRIEQGNRIEVQMPDPGPGVIEQREAYKQAQQEIKSRNLTRRELELAVKLDPAARKTRLDQLVRGVEGRGEFLTAAAEAYDRYLQTRIAFNEATEEQLKIELAQQVNLAKRDYEQAVEQAMATVLDMERLTRLLELSTRRDRNEKGESIPGTSQRDMAMKTLRAEQKLRGDDLERLIETYDRYAKVKGALDDPNDLQRMLQGQGVLEFRITVAPNEVQDLLALRKRLLSQGPSLGTRETMVWRAVDNPSKFFDKTSAEVEEFLARLTPLKDSEARYALIDSFFPGTIGEVYGGEFYVLLWNTSGMTMTERDEKWGVSDVKPWVDQYQFPSVLFDLNPRGQQLMGRMTGPNVGRQMAMLLDGKVLSAPTINETLGGGSVQITGGKGGFSRSEQKYLVQTLDAGSLDARLGEEPIAIRRIDSQFGADNLQSGLRAATIALIVVAVFMAVYYFFAGFVAVSALLANVVIILGVMAMYKAAFTLPGIAGIVLTIGMCVDANVLVFERIREEIRDGRDLPTALRLGYGKAFSAILDGNLTNLIVCVILFYTATVEIRGFAVVLGIGIAATLFTALFMTRVIFEIYNKWFGMPSLKMLPLAVPALEKLLHPNLDWLSKRVVFFTLSSIAIVASLVLCFGRGIDLLDIEFRAGTEVAFELKEGQMMKLPDARRRVIGAGEWFEPKFDPSKLSAQEKTLYDRAYPKLVDDVARRREELTEQIKKKNPDITTEELATRLDQATNLGQLVDVTVVPVGDRDEELRAPGFSLLSTVSDAKLMADVAKTLFADVLDVESSLNFTGSDITALEEASPYVYPITRADLKTVINRPGVNLEIGEHIGGVAIVLDQITPSTTLNDIEKRLAAMNLQPDYQDLRFRRRAVFGLTPDPGEPDKFTAAVVVISAEKLNYFDDADLWRSTLAQKEWNLVRDAMRRDTALNKVSNFTPDVARTLRNKAIVALVLSFIAIIAYIGFRFGNFLYGIAAIIALSHDVIITMGLIALSPMLDGFLGVEPYKINLGLIAALLTIVGYSLNDTIVVFDRIRENRGKLDRANEEIINRSLNQTISRTFLTSGTTMLAVVILYAFGSAGIKEFAFALIAGVFIGTYSSIAVASQVLAIGLKRGRRSASQSSDSALTGKTAPRAT